MPVLAQSQDSAAALSAPSLGGAPGTVWADGCGGYCDATAPGGVTVTAAQDQSDGSDTASGFFTALGMGAAGVELRYGESFFGRPNGGLYSRAWANAVGRTVRVGALTKSFGWVGLGVSTAFDFDSWQTGEISQTQFNVNLGLGTASMFNPAGPILIAPYIFINSTYPGGLGQWMLDNPEAMMPFAAGYMGN